VHRAVVAVVIAWGSGGCSSGAADPTPAPRDAPRAPRDASVDGRGLPPTGSAAEWRRGSIDANLGQLAGKPLYLTLCAPCHGVEGKGYAADHAPSLVSSTFLESASDSFLRRSIVFGRPGTSMAAYGKSRGGPLDGPAVERLVAFLREPAPPSKPLPPMVGGDAAAGAVIYARTCFVCHGDAKTRGEAVSLANPQLLASASDAFLRYAVASGRPGTKMEPFAGKLADAELDSVVRYVRTLGDGGPAPVELLPEPTGKEPLVLNPAGKSPSFRLRADACPPPAPGQPSMEPRRDSAALPVGGPRPSTCKPDPRFVSVDQVAKAFAAKQRMVIIDARPPSDWRRVHLAGAVSIPYHDLKRLDELPKDGTWIIAYCACPHHLSGIVVDELRKRGFAHAVVLDEGINEWHRRDLPVIAAAGVTKPLPEATPGGAIR
jgi:cytochrome c oxidase cbb3-type subunit III